MSGRKSQHKGRAAELELATILQEAGFPVAPGRSMSFGSVPDLVGLPGVHVECKRSEALRLYEAITQSQRDAERFGDGLPIVVHRRNRKPWVVSMTLADWLIIYRGWTDGREDSD